MAEQPPCSEEKYITALTGFSGCKIVLYSKKGMLFVRKTSKSKEYNERLIIQMEKQQRFLQQFSTKNIRAPAVFGQGYTAEGLFFFDMQYILGKNLIQQVADASIEDLIRISERLWTIIEIFKNAKTKNQVSLIEKSMKKIEEIEMKMVTDVLIHSDIKRLKESTAFFDSEITFDETFCHGDLTMENMLYKEDEDAIYLVDFLDNYAEHYWLDIAKLLQDIEGEWYSFRDPTLNSKNMLLNMAFIKAYVQKKLLTEEKEYEQFYYYLLALTFARILPYAKSDQTRFIAEKVKIFIGEHHNTIQQMSIQK